MGSAEAVKGAKGCKPPRTIPNMEQSF